MLPIRRLIDISAIVQARFQCHLNMHFIVYCFFFFIGAVHFWITILLPASQVILVIKWFDISFPVYQFDNKILLCILMPMVYLPILLIARQVYIAARYSTLKFSNIQKYTTKIVGALGILMSTALMLTVVRVCINLIKKGQFDIFYYLAWVTVVLFTAVLVPFYGLFMTDLSPSSKIIYSSLTYLNFERWTTVMRIALCFAKVFMDITDAAFVYTCLISSLFLVIKDTILHYNYDRYFRLVLYGMIWITVVRSVASLYNKPIAGGIVAFGCPIFVMFIFWCVNFRLKKMMEKEKPTIKQMKIVVSFLNDFQDNLNHLTYFLLNHQRRCQNPECRCQNLDISQKSTSDQQGINSWYQFLQEIIKAYYNPKQLSELPLSKKRDLLGKLADLSIVQCDYLAKRLRKRNSALYLLQRVKQELDVQNFYCVNLRAYYRRYFFQMENTMVYDCRQEGTINIYALNYYEYQKKIENLVILMHKSTLRHQSFWQELLKKQPDVEKIVQCVKKAYHSNILVELSLKDLKKDVQVQSIIYPIYFPYFEKVINKDIPKPKKRPIEDLKLSQDMKRFSFESKTAVCLVNVNNCKDIGTLIHSNLFFEQLTGHSCHSRANVDDFILTPLVKSHRQSMTKFIENGQYFIQRKKVLMKDLNEKIFFSDIIIQIYPCLKDGLNVCVCLIPLQPQSILISNNKAQILSYSPAFQEQMTIKNNVQQLDEVFDEKIFSKLKECNQTELSLRGIKYQMKFLYEITVKEQPPLYVISVNIISEEDQIQEDFFQTKKPSEQLEVQFLGQGKLNMFQIKQSKRKSTIVNNSAGSEILRRRNNQKHSGFFQKVPLQPQAEDQKQLQQVKNKAKKQTQKLQTIFQIVQNNQKCSSINLWVVFSAISIILIAGVASYNIFFIRQKIAIINTVNQERQAYNMININLHDALYGMRMANIEANLDKSTQKFNFYLNQMIKAKNNILKLYKTMQFKPKITIQEYQIIRPSQLRIQISDFFTIMEFYVLASQSNLGTASMNDINFKLQRKNIQQPLGNFKTNFVEANVNGLIGVIPNFEKVQNIRFAELDGQLGKDLSKQTIIILNPIAILLMIVLIVVTIMMLLKIKGLKENTYNLFQKITKDYIQSRKNTVQQYIKQNYPDLQQQNRKDKESIGKTFRPSNITYQLFKHTAKIKFGQSGQIKNSNSIQPAPTIFANLGKPKYMNTGFSTRSHANQSTDRQLFSNQIQQTVEDLQQPKLQKVKSKKTKAIVNKIQFNGVMPVSFQRVSKNQLVCKYFTLFLPLFLFFIAAIIIMTNGVNIIITHFQNKDLIYDQIRIAKAIKLYSYQLGLDSGLISYEQTTTIPIFLNQSMKNMYETERKIIQRIVQGRESTQAANFMFNFNERNVCESLGNISKITPNLETSFTQKQCQKLQGKVYLTKGRRAAMIAFLQAARLLLQRNSMAQSYLYDQRINYLKNQSLKLLSKLQNYFNLMEFESLDIFSQQIETLKLNFEISIYALTSVCLIFIFLVAIILYKCTRKNFFDDILEIKSIFHIVSKDTIKQNNQLRDLVSEKVDYAFLE